MSGSRVGVRWALASALLGGLGFVAPAFGDDAPALPRYRLKVGQELIYRGGSHFQYQNGSLDNEDLDRAWVTRQNPDGSWRVVLGFRSKMTQTRSPKATDLKSAAKAVASKVQEATRTAQKPPVDDDDMSDAQLGAVDLHPDGRVRLDESITQSYRPTDPETIFPPLPTDAEQAKGVWHSARIGLLEGQTDLRMGDQSGACVITADQHTPFDKIYLMSSTARFTFDPARGVVSRVETSNSQGYGFEGKGTGELVLDQVIDHDAAWAEATDREATTYFAAQKIHHAAMTKAETAEGDVKPLLAQATETLKVTRGKLTLPAFARAIDAQIKQQEQSAQYYAEQAETRRKVIGQEAADWELKDLAGATHTLREYRGRVVVLDFWYRGCGWCIRAMPQMKQLADDFRDRPVAILGMNKDQNSQDARFVADVMGLNYPTLVGATAEPEKYHVQGFPTLVIVDPQGKIAEFHVGYSANLRAEVGAAIRRLLPADAQTAPSTPRAN